MGRREIIIPHRHGARIYADDESRPTVNIEQELDCAGKQLLIFDAHEAKQVAAALIEVADTAIAEQKARDGNS